MAPTASTLEPAAAARIIAFVFRQGDADEIYTIHADGSHLVDLSNNPEGYYVPAWAPNGQQLAFISDRTGRPEIFLVRPDGSGLRQITHTPVDSKDMSGFVWLPDSAQLAVTYPTTNTSDSRVGTVRLISVDGLVRTTTALAPVDRPAWSPDGNRLAYDGLDPHDNLALFVAQADGTGAKIIVGSQGDVADTSEFLTGFAWAPDSTRLAYIVQGPLLGTSPNQHMGGPSSYARIYSIRPDGSDRQLLIDMEPMPNGLIGPSWSPDGRYLLYLIGYSGGGCFTINLVALATQVITELRNVCYLPRTTLPDWSPDGHYLALSAQPDSILLLDVADALRHSQDATGTWLTLGPDLTFDPVWQPLGH